LLLIEAGFQLTPKQKDRLSAEIDFKVNLKSELMLEELTRRMERLQNEQIEELLNSNALDTDGERAYRRASCREA
jgi:uncharacterized membrane protein